MAKSKKKGITYKATNYPDRDSPRFPKPDVQPQVFRMRTATIIAAPVVSQQVTRLTVQAAKRTSTLTNASKKSTRKTQIIENLLAAGSAFTRRDLDKQTVDWLEKLAKTLGVTATRQAANMKRAPAPQLRELEAPKTYTLPKKQPIRRDAQGNMLAPSTYWREDTK